jgi:hypothetical protein
MKCAKVRIKEEFRTEWCPEWWSSGSRNLWTSKGKALAALKYGNYQNVDEYEIVEFEMIEIKHVPVD